MTRWSYNLVLGQSVHERLRRSLELLASVRRNEKLARCAGFLDAADCYRNFADALEAGHVEGPGDLAYTLAGWRTYEESGQLCKQAARS